VQTHLLRLVLKKLLAPQIAVVGTPSTTSQGGDLPGPKMDARKKLLTLVVSRCPPHLITKSARARRMLAQAVQALPLWQPGAKPTQG